MATFAGINKAQGIAGTTSILLQWPAASGDFTAYVIYISTSANPFATGVIVSGVPEGTTKARVKLYNVAGNYMVNGVSYYFGVRTDSYGVEGDSNTVELSASPYGGQTIIRTDKIGITF